MPYENLLYEKRDRIGFITFNRPKVLNAFESQNNGRIESNSDCRARR